MNKKYLNNLIEQNHFELEKKLIEPAALALSETQPVGQFETKNLYQNRIKIQIREAFKTYENRLTEAVTLFKENGIWPQITEALVYKLLSDSDFGTKITNEKVSFQQQLGITQEQLIKFYELGVKFYEQGNFEQSRSIFLLICLLNPTMNVLWKALGMAAEQQKDFEAAALAYSFAGELTIDNLECYYHAADCFLKNGNATYAGNTIKRAIERSMHEDRLASLQDEARAMTLR